MKKITTILLLVFLFSLSIFAQSENDNEKKACPEITILGPATSAAPGDTQTFVLTIGGEYDEDKLKINWSVDKGTIVGGQGTKTLLVINTLDPAETIIVTADVVTSEDCHASESEATVHGDPPDPMLIDEFGNIGYEDIYARIDAFLVELQNNPSSQGYIVNYGKQKNIRNREKFIRNHINQRKFDFSRITFVNGGKEKEIRTRVWVVPSGADASTID